MPSPGIPVSPGAYRQRRKKALEVISRAEPETKRAIKKTFNTVKQNRKMGGIDSPNAKAHVAELYRNTRSIKYKPNTKLGGREMDPTKIKGFQYGKGTE